MFFCEEMLFQLLGLEVGTKKIKAASLIPEGPAGRAGVLGPVCIPEFSKQELLAQRSPGTKMQTDSNCHHL